ncbi:MAG: hypothetical protein COA37_21920 [Hoeflea sp.]|uniref:DUF167 family protein n=1 Tax=Hoeflea sp. TaxID=1940281 RepID=UPI000C0F8583|nr:DUF167 family protein [Hoeflea sp.]PHR17694.1 MAG: hypothetical protein COA37_21920 [Hoeflea sp.]
MSSWYKIVDDGVELSVRLTPSASLDAIDGLVEDAAGMVRLKARVRAVAEKNKANRALEKLIAKKLKTAKTAVRVVSGETSRSKIIRVEGDPDDLLQALEALAG